MTLATTPTRVLFRAFDRTRRTPPSSPYSLTGSPEHRAVVLLQMGDELHRRGFRDPGCLWVNP